MATTSGVSRSFPTVRYLVAPFRWTFASRRRVVTVAAALLAIVAAPVLWWAMQLLGLPDIGEPFDVAEFRASTIPEARNAFVLYNRAAERCKLLSAPGGAYDANIDWSARWPDAHPKVRQWVEDNREALELYRQGTERPDALDPDLARNRDGESIGRFRFFHALALLEASRLEEQGNMAGAWTWYRAALRGCYHLGLRGTIVRRLIVQSRDAEFRRRFTTWADDRRTTPDLIRRAIDDVVACGALVPSDTFLLKAEYLSVLDEFGGTNSLGRQSDVLEFDGWLESRGLKLDLDQVRRIADAWRFWRREPERSRRVLGLVIANWLAYDALPPARRPPPDPGVIGPFTFYNLGPDAPAGARALSPEALDRWVVSTTDAREWLGTWNLQGLRARERRNHRNLVVLLASELYRREHGTFPPSDEALVGPYLKELPDDGLDDAGQGVHSGGGAASDAGGSAGQERPE